MTAITELGTLLDNASEDEKAVVLEVARRVMGKGRRKHGPMFLANDDRDWREELSQELWDALAYAACNVVRRRHNVERFKSAAADLVSLADAWNDEEETGEHVRSYPVNSEPRTTDYCLDCGESPESGTHVFKHEYKDPRLARRREQVAREHADTERLKAAGLYRSARPAVPPPLPEFDVSDGGEV